MNELEAKRLLLACFWDEEISSLRNTPLHAIAGRVAGLTIHFWLDDYGYDKTMAFSREVMEFINSQDRERLGKLQLNTIQTVVLKMQMSVEETEKFLRDQKLQSQATTLLLENKAIEEKMIAEQKERSRLYRYEQGKSFGPSYNYGTGYEGLLPLVKLGLWGIILILCGLIAMQIEVMRNGEPSPDFASSPTNLN